MTPADFERRFAGERSTIDRIVALLDTYEMPATWAVVGHLFLDQCSGDRVGEAHPTLTAPRADSVAARFWGADPLTSRERDPLFYGDDVIEALTSSRTAHEIACHSFFHAPFDDPAMTADVVRSDLAECRRLASERGIELKSFVFPRNKEAHHDVLRAEGFTAYRGADPTWHAPIKGLAGRLAHLVDQAAAITPPVSRPVETQPGLWNVPGSMMLLHRSGLRRVVPMRSRVAKARAGLQRAVHEGAVFHLWTHPFNLAGAPHLMVRALERVLRDAAALRDRGELAVETMATVAEHARQANLGPR